MCTCDIDGLMIGRMLDSLFSYAFVRRSIMVTCLRYVGSSQTHSGAPEQIIMLFLISAG
ncbi:hypothetical protein SPHV1_160066 [Novosphingobium sp. KN65.2]|nr:hypothetical protein SPHV1_160066 [Novosphingobium sp. KN65.2]